MVVETKMVVHNQLEVYISEDDSKIPMHMCGWKEARSLFERNTFILSGSEHDICFMVMLVGI